MNAVIERDRQETGAVNNLPWIQEIKDMLDGIRPLKKLPLAPPYADFPFEEWPVYALGNDQLAQELVFWSLARHGRWNIEINGKRRAHLHTRHGDVVTAVFGDGWRYEGHYFIDIFVNAKTWPELDRKKKFTARGIPPYQTARYLAAIAHHTGKAIAQMLESRADAQIMRQPRAECHCDD